MNGYQVAETLRQEERSKDSLIIAVSGYGEEQARERSQEAGFDHHLLKPVDIESSSPGEFHPQALTEPGPVLAKLS